MQRGGSPAGGISILQSPIKARQVWRMHVSEEISILQSPIKASEYQVVEDTPFANFNSTKSD